jgi:hypothetical protein
VGVAPLHRRVGAGGYLAAVTHQHIATTEGRLVTAEQSRSLAEEEWRDVPNYEGLYQVSNHGAVRSCDRVATAGWPRHIRGVQMSPQVFRTGHLYISLSRGGVPAKMSVHRLVGFAFLADSYFEGAEICHGDGDPTNNHVDNLRWGTASDNQKDRIRHGTNRWASRTHCERGHLFEESNTRWVKRSSGRTHRQCRRCSRDASRRYYRNRKGASA